VREAISSRFKWVLVDEFQDTNIVQLKLYSSYRKCTVTFLSFADDAQSIYSFRGARFENVKEIMKDVQGFKIQTIIGAQIG